MHNAVLFGDLEEVKRLFQLDPLVVSRLHDWDESSPLHYASQAGQVEVAAWLLGHGADIEKECSGGRTACLVACERGHLSMLNLLLEKRADPTTATNSGWTPLMEASLRGHLGVVDRLLQHPRLLATINHRDPYLRQTALWCACQKGHGGVVRRLLEAGADPTFADKAGRSPMAIARISARVVCVMILEEWERHYLLTKARRLHDANHDDDITQSLAQHHPSSSSSSSSSSSTSSTTTMMTQNQVKRARTVKPPPVYLQKRVEKGKPLPKVEVAHKGRRTDSCKSVKEMDEGLLVALVLEEVVCGGLKGELFVELMEEVLGMTG